MLPRDWVSFISGECVVHMSAILISPSILGNLVGMCRSFSYLEGSTIGQGSALWNFKCLTKVL